MNRNKYLTLNIFRILFCAIAVFSSHLVSAQHTHSSGPRGTLTINCPNDTSVSNNTGECGAIVNYTTPVGTSTASGATTTLVSGFPSGSLFPVGTTPVTYLVTDDDLDSLNCTFYVTVVDTEPPVVNCDSTYDVTVPSEPGMCGATVNYSLPSGTDNCGIDTIERFGGLASGSFFPTGVTFCDFEYLDAAGNSAFCRIIVTVLDSSNSSLNCPGDITVTVHNACDTIVNYAAPDGSTLCPGYSVGLTSGLGSGGDFPVGTTTETYTAINNAAQTLTCSFQVTVLEDVPPVFSGCLSDTTVTALPGNCSATVSFAPPTATDNCDPNPVVARVAGLAPGSSFPTGTTTEIYTATDASGNVDTCSFSITVTEAQPPVIICPGDTTVDNSPGQCGAVVNFNPPNISDNCPGATLSQLGGLPSGSLFPVGITTERFKVTDAAGNVDSCSFLITVVDTEPPVSTPSDTTVFNEPGSCGATVNYPIPTASDNCGVASVVLSSGLGSGSFFPVGSSTETYLITDVNGNTSTASFVVTVQDTEPPVIACPPDVNLVITSGACDTAYVFSDPAVTDNCPGVTLTHIGGPTSGTPLVVGPHTVIYKATDAHGNSDTCSFVIHVKESIPPVITCLPDITVYATSSYCGAFFSFTKPTATDNCGPAIVTQIGGLPSGSTYPVGTNTLTFKATDPSGNTDTCSFHLNVLDTISPVISNCADIQTYADSGMCGANVNYTTPTVTDNCPNDTLVLVSGSASGSFFPIGNTTVTYAAVDPSGNSDTCSFVVTVTDTISPTITCPGNMSVETSGACDTVLTYAVPVGLDNCPGSSTTLTSGLGSGGDFPVGTSTETYTVTDAYGNSASCSFNVSVKESVNPIITCPSDTMVYTPVGSCTAVLNYPAPLFSDNCSGASLSMTSGLPSGSAFPIGNTSVTYMVIDASNNNATCSFQVAVIDTLNPVFSCPGDMTLYTDNTECGAVANYSINAIDNCGDTLNPVLQSGLPSGSLFPIGLTHVAYMATDSLGNQDSCSFDVTVLDTLPPDFTNCPDTLKFNATSGSCNATITFNQPNVTDGCSFTVAQTAGPASGSTMGIGDTTITFTAIDTSGNSSSCSFVVAVLDVTPPTFLNCPGDTTTCVTTITFDTPVATDDCGNAAVQLIAGLPSGSTFPFGNTQEVFVATDEAGNTDTCSFTIHVVQNLSRANAGPDQLLCNQDNTNIQGNQPTDGTGTWFLASGNGDIANPDTNTTAVTNLQDGANQFVWSIDLNNGCPPSTDTVKIIVQTGVSITLGADLVIQTGQTVQLNSTATPPGGEYNWTPTTGLSCTDCANPVASPVVNTTYTVMYTSDLGCTASTEQTIQVQGYLPTAFTPDGDGTNDVWNIPGIGSYPQVSVKIFDRWGTKVFESTGYHIPWDGTFNGKPLPAASYYFTIDYHDSTKSPISGTVTIIR